MTKLVRMTHYDVIGDTPVSGIAHPAYSPFLEVLKESSLGTCWMSYTMVLRGNTLSLLRRYTAYLKASSAALSFWSSVKMAPATGSNAVLSADDN